MADVFSPQILYSRLLEYNVTVHFVSYEAVRDVDVL